MRSALPFLLLTAFSLPVVAASSAQTVNRRSGAVCESQPTNNNLFLDGRWKNPKQLVDSWTEAAEQGNANAQLWLGVFYEQGRDGIKRDYVEAFKWLSMAAKQGQPDAQVTLGQMYENGEGVPQDYGLAAHWYRQAADHTMNLGGAGVAAKSIVELYEHGHATAQDYVFVYLWYAYVQDVDGMQDVAQKMNASQIADAQRRVRAWVNPGVPCPTTAMASLPESSATKPH